MIGSVGKDKSLEGVLQDASGKIESKNGESLLIHRCPRIARCRLIRTLSEATGLQIFLTIIGIILDIRRMEQPNQSLTTR